jgi:hypothetical protein
VVGAEGGGAVRGKRGGSGSVRWAGWTRVARKDGRSRVTRKEKTVGVTHSPYHVTRHAIGGPYVIQNFRV